MDPLIRTILELLLVVLNLAWWVLMVSAILSWLVMFGVINTRNRFVATLMDITYRLTEPLLRPIRNVVPNLGGVDISFIVLMLIIWALERLIQNYMFSSLMFR
ncbi:MULTISPECIES: YggT family protein [Nitrospirillum]|uniref:YggT family protein n=1 Tax=Nitrospirillum amazonense TaxID=28077 RepID=A0A560FM21_9PROT|nr:YggT family protein [Nitrospirillum amazonense]TWB22679.1 YggT family protein [Nitrospirillum amazonense]TWB51037.1 YggT family protein [Nitrospirillum amazonense]